MGVVDGPTHERRDTDRLCLREGAADSDHVIEGGPVDTLHHVPGEPVRLAHVKHGHERGVLQRRHRARLGDEAVARLLGGVGPGDQHLERERSIQGPVAGRVDHPHSAAAELRLQRVSTDHPPGGRGGHAQGGVSRRIKGGRGGWGRRGGRRGGRGDIPARAAHRRRVQPAGGRRGARRKAGSAEGAAQGLGGHRRMEPGGRTTGRTAPGPQRPGGEVRRGVGRGDRDAQLRFRR